MKNKGGGAHIRIPTQIDNFQPVHRREKQQLRSAISSLGYGKHDTIESDLS